MRTIEGGFVYDAAELGLDNITVPAAGGIVTGSVVPWIAKRSIHTIGLLIDQGGSGATTGDILQATFGVDGQSLGVINNSSLWAGWSNNPRFQHAIHSRMLATTGAATTGNVIAGELARVCTSPYIRFSVRNNHATIDMTNFRLLHVFGFYD